MRLLTTNRFEKDLKRTGRRGKDLDKLWRVVERLSSRQLLDPRNRPHRLSGDWSAFWECHIEPDWLLIWELAEDALILVRTGTHADLFDRVPGWKPFAGSRRAIPTLTHHSHP